MSGDRIKRLTNIAALLIFALATGVAIQAGIALASRFMPRVDVIEIRAVSEAQPAEMATTAPTPALPGRYQY